MSSTLRSVTRVLTNNAVTEVAGVQILAVPAYNSNHPKGSGNGYVVSIGGKNIYMAGDTGDVAEMRALRDIDVAFLCMNIPYTMDINRAASATREFRPKIVYPYHFQNQDNSFADLNAYKRLVGSDLGIEVRIRKWY